KKALLITAGGKKVAPEPLEAELAAIPGVAQAMVIGEGRKYLTTLLTLDEQAARGLLAGAGSEGPPEAVASNATVLQTIQAGLDAVNQKRAPYEQIKRFYLLPQPFSLQAEELTPTLKIRRSVVERRYAKEIESLYTSP